MERKIYLYDRGFWVLFRMLGIFAATLSLFLTLCFIMCILKQYIGTFQALLNNYFRFHMITN